MPFDTYLLDKAKAERSRLMEGERERLFAQTVALLDKYSRRFGIRSAFIFGSVAQPRRFHEHSDIDIAIETSRPERLAEAIGQFSSQLERDVDLVDLAAVPFADRIRREGVLWTPRNS